MKTHAKFSYFIIVTSLAALVAMQPPNGRADDTTEERRKDRDDLKARIEALNKDLSHANDKQTADGRDVMGNYDLVIVNGALRQDNHRAVGEATIKAVVEFLRQRYEGANIVYPPGLADVLIPDIKLRAHDLPEMLEALRVASGNKFDWEGPASPKRNLAPNAPGWVDPATGLPATLPAADPNSGLFVLREPARAGQNERVVEAFNVAPYLALKTSEARARILEDGSRKVGSDEIRVIEAKTVDELEILIVETVASYMQTGEADVRQNLKFQYHPGATLLIVIGPRNQVEVVRKLMNALMTDPNGSRIDGGLGSVPVGAEPLSMEAIPVKFAKQETAYAAAMSLLEDKRSKVVVIDERTKTLIVTATKAEVSAIKKAVEELDQAAKPFVGDGPSTIAH